MTKYKKKELKTAVGGLRGPLLIKRHTQVQYFKIDFEGGLFSREGTIIEGKKAYQVIMSNDTDIILCNQVYAPHSSTYNPSMPSTMGTTMTGGGSSTIYYLVQGEKINQVTFDWYKKDFLDELNDIFGDCPGVNEVVQNYRDSKLKFITIYKFMEELKKCYYMGCFQEL